MYLVSTAASPVWVASVLCAIVVISSACDSDATRAKTFPLGFISAPTSLSRQCEQTARIVGYAVPCPTRIPRGLRPTEQGSNPCPFEIVGAGGCDKVRLTGPWKGWVFGSSEVAEPPEHLVIQASPSAVSYGHAVLGPLSDPLRERVRVGGWVQVGDWHARWVSVPAVTSERAMRGHEALVWTAHGHTYAIGFHAFQSRKKARMMDLQLLSGTKLVGT
jgi:hypothetical protein